MIEIKLRVPSSAEECNNLDCCVCDLNVLTCGDCEKIWEIGMRNIEPVQKLKDFPLITTGPVKIIPLSPLPHTIFVPRLFRDGDMWCALYGSNIMEGIVGFGKTPDKAVERFNAAFYEDIADERIIKKSLRKAIAGNIKDAVDVTGLFKRKISVYKR